MIFNKEKTDYYVDHNLSYESDILKYIREYTVKNYKNHYMMSSRLQGKFLSMISYMMNPNYILEIGTYTGYSLFSLYQGLNKNGLIITIDINKELNLWIKYITKNYKNNILYYNNNAKEIINNLKYKFDLIFIDCNKSDYYYFYINTLPLLRKNGIMILDNVLWKNQVVNESYNDIGITKKMRIFNLKIKEDLKVDNMILSIRDGLMIIRKL
ncbi:MAG: class I SAM-dependent methyltransferase [Bacteroides sp.]|nr:MAG: class I SAM-dependent methyltransferase [Bacteroides sp.]